jgi:hypothetical protein
VTKYITSKDKAIFKEVIKAPELFEKQTISNCVLATGPKGCGFKTWPRRWIFKGDKNPQQ